MDQRQSPPFTELLALLGICAFIFGVCAEFLKPPCGTIIDEKGGALICRYPHDDSVAFGGMSIAALLLATAIGVLPTLAHPDVLFRSAKLVVIFTISVWATAIAGGMMMWATVSEALYFTPETGCVSMKDGMFCGAAFLALIAALFWVKCHELVTKAKFAYLEDNPKAALLA